MGRGKPRAPQSAVQARKAVLDALQSPEPLTEGQARDLVDRLEREYRQAGYGEGYDEGRRDYEWG